MCCGGGGGDGADRRGSEFNVDRKGVAWGVSVGSKAKFDSARASDKATLVSIGAIVSICIRLAGAGTFCEVALSWDRGCEVSGEIIL